MKHVRPPRRDGNKNQTAGLPSRSQIIKSIIFLRLVKIHGFI